MSKLLTMQQAAEKLGIPLGTLRNWRMTGYGPKGGKLGQRVFYREADLDAWVDQQFANAGNDPTAA